MLKKRKNKMIIEMREAIFKGLTMDEYLQSSTFKDVGSKNAIKAWNRAQILTEDWKLWGEFILSAEVVPAFREFMEALDNYYNEGAVDINTASNSLRIDKNLLCNLLKLVEG